MGSHYELSAYNMEILQRFVSGFMQCLIRIHNNEFNSASFIWEYKSKLNKHINHIRSRLHDIDMKEEVICFNSYLEDVYDLYVKAWHIITDRPCTDKPDIVLDQIRLLQTSDWNKLVSELNSKLMRIEEFFNVIAEAFTHNSDFLQETRARLSHHAYLEEDLNESAQNALEVCALRIFNSVKTISPLGCSFYNQVISFINFTERFSNLDYRLKSILLRIRNTSSRNANWMDEQKGILILLDSCLPDEKKVIRLLSCMYKVHRIMKDYSQIPDEDPLKKANIKKITNLMGELNLILTQYCNRIFVDPEEFTALLANIAEIQEDRRIFASAHIWEIAAIITTLSNKKPSVEDTGLACDIFAQLKSFVQDKYCFELQQVWSTKDTINTTDVGLLIYALICISHSLVYDLSNASFRALFNPRVPFLAEVLTARRALLYMVDFKLNCLHQEPISAEATVVKDHEAKDTPKGSETVLADTQPSTTLAMVVHVGSTSSMPGAKLGSSLAAVNRVRSP